MEVYIPKSQEEYIKQQEARHTSNEHEYPLSPWHFDMFNEFNEYLKEPILDIGTRNGLLLDELKKRGFQEVYGIEITDIAKFAQKMGRPVIQYDIQKRTPFRDKYFKSAIATQVLEHCYDVNTALDEIRRILDGYIYINFPLSNNVKSWLPYGHYTTFASIDELKGLLEKHGFEVVKINDIEKGPWTKTIIAKI